MNLADRIDAYEAGMHDALAGYAQAQEDDLRAVAALDDVRNRAEAQIRATSTRKMTEAAIALAVSTHHDVMRLALSALDARIALRQAEAAVEAQKATGRALSWHVQLLARVPAEALLAA